jgi:hypothetical protein
MSEARMKLMAKQIEKKNELIASLDEVLKWADVGIKDLLRAMERQVIALHNLREAIRGGDPQVDLVRRVDNALDDARAAIERARPQENAAAKN